MYDGSSERRVDEDRRPQVRQDLREEDAPLVGAHSDRGFNELAFAQAEDLSAHDAGEVRPAEEAEHEDQIEDPGRVALRDSQARQTLGQDAGEGQDDEQERERQDEVHQATQDGIGDTAGIAGDDADEHPENDGQRGSPQWR